MLKHIFSKDFSTTYNEDIEIDTVEAVIGQSIQKPPTNNSFSRYKWAAISSSSLYSEFTIFEEVFNQSCQSKLPTSIDSSSKFMNENIE